MPSAIQEAVASSTAHGISKAAGDRAKPLKVMWILLFLVFLGLFFKGGFNLVIKLTENRLTKVYHMDEVQFLFPDLYFCPINAYSGSYPFQLEKHEADLINDEITRILKKLQSFSALETNLDDTESNRSITVNDYNVFTKAMFVQASLPLHLYARYLVQRKEQAVIMSHLRSNFKISKVRLETFFHPENLVCFKAILSAEMKHQMQSGSGALEIWLSTDPYFSDLNFTGYKLNPLVDIDNQSLSFLSWHPTNIVEKLKKSGYTMVTVPRGAYPSLELENKFHLAPGNAYSVKLEMIENSCSEELHRTHCVANESGIRFTNPMTGKPVIFNYSSAACYYQRRIREFVQALGCQPSFNPLFWKYNKLHRCLNISEMTGELFTTFFDRLDVDLIMKIHSNAVDYCKNRIPCIYPQYSTSFSFSKWPSVGSSTADFFANDVAISEKDMPGLAKLSAIARQLQSSNHSAHLEGIFRSYVSESMLSVSISAASTKSSQVVLTWSYTVTDFLADTGGLLGLYIGCSLLTLCELLELLYVLVDHVCKRRSQPAAASGEAEAAGDLVIKDGAAAAAEAEHKA